MHSKPTCPARSRSCRPCSPPPLSAPAFTAPLAGGSVNNITPGASGYGGSGGGAYGNGGGDCPYGDVAYGNGGGDCPHGDVAYGYGGGDVPYGGGAYVYGGSDGGYSDGANSGGLYDHGGHGGASYEAVPVGQAPGGGGAGHDIPSRPPGAPDGGYHRAMQQAGNGGDGIALAAVDGDHEDEGYFGDRNRVIAPLLMSCSFQPAVAAVAPAVISRGPRRRTAVVTTDTVPTGVRSSSTAAVIIVIVRNRSCDTSAAAMVQHCGRSSSKAPAPSVALAGSRGALAAMDRP